MSVEAIGRYQPGNFLAIAKDRNTVGSDIDPTRPSPDNVHFGKFREVLHDAAADTRCRSGCALGFKVVDVESFQIVITAKHERAMVGLTTVEVGFRRSQHGVEHMGLSLGYQAMIDAGANRSIDAHRRQNLFRLRTGTYHDGVRLIFAVFCDYFAQTPFNLAQLQNLFASNEPHAHRQRVLVEPEARLKWVGVSIGRAPACADDLFGKVGVDRARLIAADHPYPNAAGSSVVCQTGERLQVLFGFAQAQVAALVVLNINPQLFAKRWPDVFHPIQSQGKLARIAAGLAYTACIARSAAVKHNLLRFKHNYVGYSAFSQIIGG